MTTICGWHKPAPVVMHEKCPSCGMVAIPLAVLKFAICVNPNCPFFCFPIGEGGVSHGICADCKAEHFPVGAAIGASA